MNWKSYLEKLRAELESRMQEYCSDTTVKIDYGFTRLIVVFPADKTDIFCKETDTMAEAGRVVWISYCKGRLQAEIRPFLNV